MKKILTLAALVGATTLSFAQGTINWQNSSATLISAGGAATPAVANQFVYAVFFAPSTTAAGDSQASLGITDPAFQNALQYNANAAALGRLGTKNGLSVPDAPGSTVDFIIRGWSASAGATWAQALTFWNNGSPAADMYIGQSLIANNYVVGGGAIPVNGIMGVLPNVAGGFNMALVPGVVPEPSSLVLAGLGAASLLAFRRRN